MVPLAFAAFSVWQLEHCDWKIALPSVPSCFGDTAGCPVPATAAT